MASSTAIICPQAASLIGNGACINEQTPVTPPAPTKHAQRTVQVPYPPGEWTNARACVDFRSGQLAPEALRFVPGGSLDRWRGPLGDRSLVLADRNRCHDRVC